MAAYSITALNDCQQSTLCVGDVLPSGGGAEITPNVIPNRWEIKPCVCGVLPVNFYFRLYFRSERGSQTLELKERGVRGGARELERQKDRERIIFHSM
jgi:hypothetical protein